MSTCLAKTVFVNIPFADEYKAGYEEIIEPATSAAGLNCVRADQEPLGHIHQMMLERIFESPVVTVSPIKCKENRYFDSLPDSDEEDMIRHADSEITAVGINCSFAKLPVSVLVDNDPRTKSMYRYYKTVIEGLFSNAVPK